MAKTDLQYKLYYGFLLVILVGWIRFLLLGEHNDDHIDLTHARQVVLAPQEQLPLSGNFLASGEANAIQFDEYVSIDTGLLEALQSGFENTAINEIAFVQTGGRSLLQDIDLLIKAYDQNQAPEILPPLITKLLRVYQFEQANSYLTLYLNSLSIDQISLVSSQAIFYTLLNTPSIINNLDVKRGQIVDFIIQQRQERLITESDKIFYETLLEITTGNVMPLITAIRTINDPLYATIKQDLLDNYRIYTSIPQQPRYYLRALVALTLMKHGYFKIAEQLALSVLIDNKNYLLPYQILAYSHFVTNERAPAREYLLRLVDLDQSNERSYKFMIGVTFFWQQNYTQALLYFAQVQQSEFMLDTIRYKILSYHALNDNRNLATTMRELLNSNQADALDLLQLFELLFFEPYQQGANFTLYSMAPDIAIGSLEQCFTRIAGSQRTLCEYGRLGQLLASGQEPESIDALIQLAQQFPRSSLYQVIGTFFLKTQKPDRAREFFLKALVISGDNDHTQRIRSLIVDTE